MQDFAVLTSPAGILINGHLSWRSAFSTLWSVLLFWVFCLFWLVFFLLLVSSSVHTLCPAGRNPWLLRLGWISFSLGFTQDLTFPFLALTAMLGLNCLFCQFISYTALWVSPGMWGELRLSSPYPLGYILYLALIKLLKILNIRNKNTY